MLLAAVIGCGQGHAAMADSARTDSLASARQDSVNRAQPGYIVDSILPVEEQLRRFRTGHSDTARLLVGGASSADSLVRQFAASLQASDTAALVRLTISRAEFAWLVYPESPLSRRPYQQAPDLVWMMHTAASSIGLERALTRLGGKQLGYRAWSCNAQPVMEGSNRIWKDCVVRFDHAPSPSGEMQLFSSIIERGGRFKILSYDNAF
jgi:hypothetical protein